MKSMIKDDPEVIQDDIGFKSQIFISVHLQGDSLQEVRNIIADNYNKGTVSFSFFTDSKEDFQSIKEYFKNSLLSVLSDDGISHTLRESKNILSVYTDTRTFSIFLNQS